MRGGLTVDAVPVSLSTMVLTWPSLLWFYISHLVWPVGLSEFYDFPYVIGAQFKEFVLPLLGVALVGGTLVWWGIRVPTVMFASAWMLFPLLPALNLSVLPHGDFVHDRFLYLPSVGYALLLAIGLRRLPRGQNASFGQPMSQVVAVTGLVIGLALGTVSQAAHWKTDRDLFTRGITIAPKNKTAINNLATVLLREGEIEAAIELYQRILANHPTAWQATTNLGQAYLGQGDLLNAERYFKRALELDPDHSDTYLYLGFTAMRAGSPDAAETAFRHALNLQPDRPGYYYALGRALKAQDRTQEARWAFEQELRHPSTAKFARANRGNRVVSRITG